MKRTLFLLFLPILISACSEQTENLAPQTESTNPYQRSQHEALRIATYVFKNTSQSTRSASASTLSVEPMLSRRHRTRLSGTLEADTTYFIINNGDNQGFAFISGDKRQTPLLAFSDSGSLHSKDFEENPGLSIFKEQCENARVMLSDGDKIINGHSIDWDLLVYFRSKSIKPIDIDSHYRKEIATLFHQVGEVVKARYEVDGTAADRAGIKENLEKIGYKEILKHSPADSSSVIRDILPTIQKGHPALVTGFLRGGSAGHMWLADGWGKFVEVTTYSNKPDTEYWSKKSMNNIYLHMNWGWSGQDNGFFLAGSYKVNDPKAVYDKYDHVSTRNYDLSQFVSFSIFTPQQ